MHDRKLKRFSSNKHDSISDQKKSLTKFMRELFMGNYTPPAVNIAFLILSFLLIIGVIYAFFANNYLTFISAPVLNVTDNGKANNTLFDAIYVSDKYGYKINFPEGWKMDSTFIEDKEVLKIYSVDKNDFYLSFTITENIKDIFKDNQRYHSEFNGSLFYTFEYVPVATGVLNEQQAEEFLEDMIKSFAFSNKDSAGKDCKPTGCSGQICADVEIVTTCEYAEHYACFSDAVCERQRSGECGWVLDEKFMACFAQRYR